MTDRQRELDSLSELLDQTLDCLGGIEGGTDVLSWREANTLRVLLKTADDFLIDLMTRED